MIICWTIQIWKNYLIWITIFSKEHSEGPHDLSWLLASRIAFEVPLVSFFHSTSLLHFLLFWSVFVSLVPILYPLKWRMFSYWFLRSDYTFLGFLEATQQLFKSNKKGKLLVLDQKKVFREFQFCIKRD